MNKNAKIIISILSVISVAAIITIAVLGHRMANPPDNRIDVEIRVFNQMTGERIELSTAVGIRAIYEYDGEPKGVDIKIWLIKEKRYMDSSEYSYNDPQAGMRPFLNISIRDDTRDKQLSRGEWPVEKGSYRLTIVFNDDTGQMLRPVQPEYFQRRIYASIKIT
jgi:hypothetical protein